MRQRPRRRADGAADDDLRDAGRNAATAGMRRDRQRPAPPGERIIAGKSVESGWRPAWIITCGTPSRWQDSWAQRLRRSSRSRGALAFPERSTRIRSSILTGPGNRQRPTNWRVAKASRTRTCVGILARIRRQCHATLLRIERVHSHVRDIMITNETTTTEPWRRPRRSNNPTATVQCPTCGAEPRMALHGVHRRSDAPGLPQGQGPQCCGCEGQGNLGMKEKPLRWRCPTRT